MRVDVAWGDGRRMEKRGFSRASKRSILMMFLEICRFRVGFIDETRGCVRCDVEEQAREG